ncbi:Dehydratase [Bacillus cereus AH676]|nr:Dehydratase [Bacillus cereus AH676]
MWELTAAQTKLFLPPTTSRWLTFFDMEKKEDKMNPFQEAQTVPELRYDEIQVGDQASLTKTITDEDVINFAKLTGDVNPIHILDSFAKTTIFKERIAHGMLVSSFISTILGTKLPGKNTIYLSQNVSFRAPVKIGDTLRVVAEVIKKRDDKKIITLQTNIYNQSDDIVVEGTATILKKE